MRREQAEIKAQVFNTMAKGAVGYMAHPMDKTKWEADRWGVVQTYGEGYPKNVVGIAAA
jgi:hypothetical protein